MMVMVEAVEPEGVAQCMVTDCDLVSYLNANLSNWQKKKHANLAHETTFHLYFIIPKTYSVLH